MALMALAWWRDLILYSANKNARYQADEIPGQCPLWGPVRGAACGEEPLFWRFLGDNPPKMSSILNKWSWNFRKSFRLYKTKLGRRKRFWLFFTGSPAIMKTTYFTRGSCMFMSSALISMISQYIILISVEIIIRKENSAFGHA